MCYVMHDSPTWSAPSARNALLILGCQTTPSCSTPCQSLRLCPLPRMHPFQFLSCSHSVLLASRDLQHHLHSRALSVTASLLCHWGPTWLCHIC